MTHSYSPHPLCLRVKLGFTHRFFISFPFRSGGTRYFLKKNTMLDTYCGISLIRTNRPIRTLFPEGFVRVSSAYDFNVSSDDFNQV